LITLTIFGEEYDRELNNILYLNTSGQMEIAAVGLICGHRLVLDIGLKVHGFTLGRGRWIFKSYKNLHPAFLRRVSKAVCPMS
jgi:hypothetical protein